MNKHFQIWKIMTTNGCVFEDGSDTRKDEVEFVLVSCDEEDSFAEKRASDCGDQDYSFQISHKLVCELWSEELEAMKKLFEVLK